MPRFSEVKTVIELNHRNPSKYVTDETLLVHFLKRGQKLMNVGELKEQNFIKFKELLVLIGYYKRVNQ